MVCLENVLKISLQDVLKMSWRHLEDVFKTSWWRLEDVLKTSWKRLEDALKIYGQEKYIGLHQDVFWRRKAKVNIFFLIKTSWRLLEDVFWRRRRKTSSRRLHQGECLLGSYFPRGLVGFFLDLFFYLIAIHLSSFTASWSDLSSYRY